MSDVTFVRGYGFPRGSSMDYAGYGDVGGGCGCGGGCGPCSQRAVGRAMGRFGRPVRMHDPSLFATIPSMDGFGDELEVSLGPVTVYSNTPGERVLPTLDPMTGRWYDDQGVEVDPNTGLQLVGPQYQPGNGGLFALLGIGLIGAALFLK